MSLAYLYSDLKSIAGSEHKLRLLKSLVFDHTAHLTIMLRLGQSFLSIPYIGRILSFVVEYLIRVIYASDISCKAKLGPGLCIMHGHDIVIGADVVVGENFKIFNGVTLGNKDLTATSKDSQPKIGNNVTVCTGAKVLGALELGCNIIVGANSVVLKSFGNGCTLVGVPARAI